MAASGIRWTAVAVAVVFSFPVARPQTAGAPGHMPADSLAALLRRAPANGEPITVSNQQIDGGLNLGDETGTLDASTTIRLDHCHFTEHVRLSGCHFHGSLTLTQCTFDKGLDLSESTVDGDFTLREPVIAWPQAKPRALDLSGLRVGDELFIGRPRIEGGIDAVGVSTERLNVILTGASVGEVNFAGLTANSASFRSAALGILDVPLLALNNATLKNALSARNLRCRILRMTSASVGERTQFDNVRIEDELGLSGATLHAFRYTPAATDRTTSAWPGSIRLDGMTFADSVVTLPKDAPRPDDYTQIKGVGDTLLFLQHAEYSQSAYESLQGELLRRGQVPQADAVFLAMHHANREQQWTASPRTWPWGLFDSFQEYVLGYGRSPVAPGIWSALFVLLGWFAFRNRTNMIEVEDSGKPPEFSAAWYSLEMFLPIVDLGMAKAWRPSTRLLQTYARVHQIAGWILVPVALEAITGVAR